MIGLDAAINAAIDEFDAAAMKDLRLAIHERDGDDGGPSGMCAEAESNASHGRALFFCARRRSSAQAMKRFMRTRSRHMRRKNFAASSEAASGPKNVSMRHCK